VSGVPFVIDSKSPAVRDGETTYYFCCATCVEYFRAHRQDVLRKRGLG
jgi:YHS domain-containing protein